MPTIEETLKKGVSEFNDILISPYSAKGVTGTLYMKKKTNPTRGIVVIHGIWMTRESYDFLNKRLADQGYCVYAINLPSHGEDISKFNIALASEYAQTAVRILRLLGLRQVCVLGHSAGSIAALFATCGYNRIIESNIYTLFERCSYSLRAIASLEKKYGISNLKSQIMAFIRQRSAKNRSKLAAYIKEEITELDHYKRQFDEQFKALKRVILEGLKQQQRFTSQRIDALILVGMPIGFQHAFPVPVHSLKRINRRLLFKILDSVSKAYKESVAKEGVATRYSESNMGLLSKEITSKSDIHWAFLRISDVDEILKYINTIKNPVDYLNLIDFFAKRELEKYEEKEKAYLESQVARLEKRKREFEERNGYKDVVEIESALKELEKKPPILSFIRRYKREVIDSVPKLVVHGEWDEMSRPFFKKNRFKVREFYHSLGDVKVVSYERMRHQFIKEGLNPVSPHMLSYPQMLKDIIAFLNQTL